MSQSENFARKAGQIARGLFLSILLTQAIFRLIALSSNAQVFRYQGF